MSRRRDLGPWIGFETTQPGANLNVLCFPHAGAGGSIFAPWGECLPPRVNLYPVLLPGREARCSEPMPTSLGRLAEDFIADNHHLLDAPGLVLLGQCTGAWLAHEVATRLVADHEVTPRLLVCIGSGPVDRPVEPVVEDGASADDICSTFVRLGVLDPAVASVPALRDFFLPVIMTDHRLQQEYRYRPSAPLSCPIVVARGTDDAQVSATDVRGWTRLSTAGIREFEFSGGHFVAGDAVHQLLTFVEETVAEVEP